MIPPKVQAVLEANQLEALTFEPGSTPTSEMAAAKIGRGRSDSEVDAFQRQGCGIQIVCLSGRPAR